MIPQPAQAQQAPQARPTDILCTLGPASSQQAVLRDMRKSGMTMVRINMAHASRQDLLYLVGSSRAVTNRLGVLVDLPGPKIRIGSIVPRTLAVGMPLVLTTAPEAEAGVGRIPVDYPLLHEKVAEGDRLKVDDGKISLVVRGVEGNDIHCEVEFGGELLARKGINAHNVDEGFPAITAHDLALIPQVAEAKPDYVAVSFCQGPENIMAVRDALQECAGTSGGAIRLIAKIETPEAVENLKAIVGCDETWGVMVARGDLAYEGDRADLLHSALRIIREARRQGKYTIMATEMLDSMIARPTPTRAEIFDISLAVALGVDAVMTSGETAVGRYPVDAVRVMREIVTRAEERRSELRGLLAGIVSE